MDVVKEEELPEEEEEKNNEYDTGEMDELIVAMGRTENALNVDLINSAELNTSSTDPSCCQNGSTHVKKRQKFVLVRQMLDAKYDTGDFDESSVAGGLALNADLINSALELINPAEVNTTSTDPSCKRKSKGTTRVRAKKRRKYLTAREMLDAKTRGEYVQVISAKLDPSQSLPEPQGALSVLSDSVAVHPSNKSVLKLLGTSSADHSYRDLVFTQTSDVAFTAKFTTKIFNREQFASWKKYFEIQTRTQFTIDRTPKVNGKLIIFTQRLSCLHNVYHGKVGRGKNTACPARMSVQIHSGQQSGRRRIRKGGNLNVSHPCLISLTWDHNHPIVAADVLRRQNVSSEVDFKLENLFKNAHSTKTALRCIKMDIEDNLVQGDRLEHVLVNRSLCPDYRHCNYILNKIFPNDYDNPNDNERISSFIETLNSGTLGDSVICEKYASSTLVAICTKFMKRVHAQLPESAEFVFVDSSGDLERGGFRAFLFMTHSKAGALPLVIGITPSDSEAALTKLFSLMQRVLPDNAFFNRGRSVGPQLFMTDDCATEQLALNNVWPMSTKYLCQFHVLQSQWRYLLLGEHNICATDRPALFQMVKTLMFAHTEDDLYEAYAGIFNSSLLQKYLNFQQQLSAMVEKKSRMWCSAFRKRTLVRGNDTNKYDETSMRILKDVIFQRTRKFNLAQMTDFITLRFSAYYQRRLVDYAHLQQIRPPRNKYPPYTDQQINFVSDDIYEIESSERNGTTYTVNMAVCICTCQVGQTGKFCEHIYYVHTQTNCGDVSYRLSDQRELMYYLACGKQPNEGWMDALPSGSEAQFKFNDLDENSPVRVATGDKNSDLQIELQKVYQIFADKLKKVVLERAESDSPREIIAGFRAATAMLSNITTTKATSSALLNFGRYPQGSVNSTKCHRLGNIPVPTTVGNILVQTTVGNAPVHTTAVARKRKLPHGRTSWKNWPSQ